MLQRFINFTKNITIISKGIEQIKNEVMNAHGLNGGDSMYLFYLSRYSEGLTVSQMSEINNVSKSAVSRIYAGLYEKGYIHYPNHDGGKKYNTPAVLTKKGNEQAARIEDAICKYVDMFSLTNIADEDRTTMYRSLRTIANNISTYLNDKNKQ